MDNLCWDDIELGIDRVVEKLSPDSGVHDLYPNQRLMLHQFCNGQDIFYTGKNLTQSVKEDSQ